VEQLRAWLTDLVSQMPSILEWAVGVDYITDDRMKALHAEGAFYTNLLLLFDTGTAPEPSSLPPVDDHVAQGFLAGIQHWQQREAESAGVVLTPARSEDRRRRQAILQRLGGYAARYPTTRA
jgi:hypothetical protein